MRYVVGALGGITAALTLASATLWAAGKTVASAVLATITVGFWLLLIVIATVAVTAWWTRETMQAGARIALNAQSIDNQWDARKTQAFAGLAQTMLRIGRTLGRETERAPALPLPTQQPQQQEEWLPPLQELALPDADDRDGREERL